MAVGKGSILRATSAAQENKELKKDGNNSFFTEIPVSQITKVPKSWFGYRVENKQEAELMKSIKEYGQLEPVILRPLKDNQFQLLSGYRRMAAIKALKKETILARILEEVEDKRAREIFQELHKKDDLFNIHRAKFQVVSMVSSDMPDYLL